MVACGIALDIIKKELLELKREEVLYIWFEMDGEDVISASVEKRNAQNGEKEVSTSFSKWANTNNFEIHTIGKKYEGYIDYTINMIFSKLFLLSSIKSMKLKFLIDRENTFSFCMKLEGDKEWWDN